MSKYDALMRFLAAETRDRIPMTFAEIEGVLQAKLPRSADTYRAWWSNNPANNVMTRAWLSAGFATEQVDIAGRTLVFRRAAPSSMRTIDGVVGGSSTAMGGFMETAAPSVFASSSEPALFGWLKGTVVVAPGTDLTAPADPDWGASLDGE